MEKLTEFMQEYGVKPAEKKEEKKEEEESKKDEL